MTYDALFAIPKTTVSANLLCYGLPITEGDWGGVKLSDLLTQASEDPAVTSVDFAASDGYKVSIPIETAMQQNVIIAYELNGVSLSEGLRLVIPDANGNLWISMITSISMNNSPISQGVSGNSEPEPIGQYQSSNNITVQPSQQQSHVQPQPTASSDKTTVEPTTAPTNITVPQSEQKVSSSPIETVYLVMLGVIVVVVAVSLIVRYKKKKD